MKKTYINPTMTVVKVKAHSLLSGSTTAPVVGINTDGSVEADLVESRYYNVWDDDIDY